MEGEPRRVEVDAEGFRGQKIMPLEDVDTFSEDDMHGDYVRFVAVRYPETFRYFVIPCLLRGPGSSTEGAPLLQLSTVSFSVIL